MLHVLKGRVFIQIICNCPTWEISLPLPICLIIYLYQYGYRYYTLGYTPILLYFPSSHVSSIDHREIFQLTPVPYPHRSFAFCLFVCSNSSLHSGTTRCSIFISYITCSRPIISHFSKEPLEPFDYPFCTLPHHLALFSHMIVILLSFSLSYALLIPLSILLPLSYPCSSIPYCMCECMCVFS